jgi:pilus assembly protein Flp/PilA
VKAGAAGRAARNHACEPQRKQGEEVSTQPSKQSGQGMVEYALILVLVSIVVIVILLTMGGQIANVFSNIVTALNA